MPSNYAEITKYNEEQLGKDTKSRRDQVCMYSDPTHFIYEILQNADDYDADIIKFMLFPDKLVIEHNGIPFTQENVKSISYFGESTSRKDLVKTGRFGLGFKSVFAFTASPAIYSDDEHFKIYGLYRLRGISAPSDLKKLWTRITLPFNHESLKPNYVEKHISPEIAFQRIAKRLKHLDTETLLFTQKLREIQWIIYDKENKENNEEKGHYLREDHDRLKLHEHLKQRETDIINENELHSFLVFERPITWEDKRHKPVEIAFKFSQNNQILATNLKLCVLFETETETHCKFILNGPYRTNPARETIAKEDDFNFHLIQETAAALKEALSVIRDKGLLSVEFLELLPIRSNDFSEGNLFYPIYKVVREALKYDKLLPTAHKSYIDGNHAKLARSKELISLFSSEQISKLFESKEPLHWLSEKIKEKTDLYIYLVGKKYPYEVKPLIENIEVRPEILIRKIIQQKTFLEYQKDSWVAEFYILLGTQKSLWREFKYTPFLRLQNGEHVSLFSGYGDPPNAYLPPKDETNFPVVKREIVNKEGVRDFLKSFGLSDPDIIDEVVNYILPGYPNYDISCEKHKFHLMKILRALRTDSTTKKDRLIERLKKIPFIQAINPTTGKEKFQKPSKIYFPSSELEFYFDGNPEIWFLKDDKYNNEEQKLFEELGVARTIRIHCREKNYKGYVKVRSSRGEHKRGLDGFDPDFWIDGLDDALNHPNARKSAYIWKIMSQYIHTIQGESECSTRQGFDNPDRIKEFSKAGEFLTQMAWLPNKNKDNQFYSPTELSLEDLPEEFKHNENLRERLGMKSSSVTTLAQEIGVKIEHIEILRNTPEKFEKFLELEATHELKVQKVKFPERETKNPEYREKRIGEEVRNAPFKSYEKRERSVRTSSSSIDQKIWLKNEYTNEEGQMVCQICKKEMSFKKHDGEYYFEAVELFGKDDSPVEYHELYIALCPLCSAKYKEFVKKSFEQTALVKKAILEHKEPEISIRLEDNIQHSIRFVRKHFYDLKAVLKKLAGND